MSAVAHYIAGVLPWEAMVEIVESLSEVADLKPGDRVRTLRDSTHGVVVARLDDGRLQVDDSSVKWIGADGTLCRIPVATVSALGDLAHNHAALPGAEVAKGVLVWRALPVWPGRPVINHGAQIWPSLKIVHMHDFRVRSQSKTGWIGRWASWNAAGTRALHRPRFDAPEMLGLPSMSGFGRGCPHADGHSAISRRAV
jgi:hypothetical protein